MKLTLQLKQALRLSRLLLGLLIPIPLMGLTGCNQQQTVATTADKQAFAPGMNNLSPEAKALKEKNDQDMRAKQLQAAQNPQSKR